MSRGEIILKTVNLAEFIFSEILSIFVAQGATKLPEVKVGRSKRMVLDFISYVNCVLGHVLPLF